MKWGDALGSHPSGDQFHRVLHWWQIIEKSEGTLMRMIHSLLQLVAWQIWNEHMAWIFQCTHFTIQALTTKVKEEAFALWFAGAEWLRDLVFKCEVWALPSNFLCLNNFDQHYM